VSRDDVLARLTSALPRPGLGRQLVGVDGVDGAGKTIFAQAWVEMLEATGVSAHRVGLDGFLAPRAVRHRRGRTSPEGFYLDSYDLRAFVEAVVVPLRPGGSGRITPARYDVSIEAPVDPEPLDIPVGGVVVVDGMFLHRGELHDLWDYSVFLDVPFAETCRRMAVRDGGPADPQHPANARYVGGQRIYLATDDPIGRADAVVNNTDPARPTIRGSAG
jgi:uridine kinase